MSAKRLAGAAYRCRFARLTPHTPRQPRPAPPRPATPSKAPRGTDESRDVTFLRGLHPPPVKGSRLTGNYLGKIKRPVAGVGESRASGHASSKELFFFIYSIRTTCSHEEGSEVR
ncbi:hypothetical protein E2C01_031944 [Portunus trituberculatus]|uniref:Uncharacterized protein n=1 Tax=Portunus trituberculatus TaxID=210409 RepID=A0A5B7EZ08_PORTR|nr:hypothetical protein [Portunus trituberculatus]